MKLFGDLWVLAGTILVVLLISKQSTALTEAEIAKFGAREHIDPNTDLQGFITITEDDADNYLIEANGIPDHEAGPYPNEQDSSEIIEQTYMYYIPKTPSQASEPGDLPLGTIGFALNGVPFFNPYTAIGTDAVENEIFDSCDGHPTPEHGAYHYHDEPSCVFDTESTEPSDIVGVALDGYPIYGPIDENGNELRTADLDDCHGRWVDENYRYHLTEDFPYILGCYAGVVDERNSMPGGGGGGGPPRPQNNGDDDPEGGDNGSVTLTCCVYLQLFLAIVSLCIFFQ